MARTSYAGSPASAPENARVARHRPAHPRRNVSLRHRCEPRPASHPRRARLPAHAAVQHACRGLGLLLRRRRSRTLVPAALHSLPITRPRRNIGKRTATRRRPRPRLGVGQCAHLDCRVRLGVPGRLHALVRSLPRPAFDPLPAPAHAEDSASGGSVLPRLDLRRWGQHDDADCAQRLATPDPPPPPARNPSLDHAARWRPHRSRRFPGDQLDPDRCLRRPAAYLRCRRTCRASSRDSPRRRSDAHRRTTSWHRTPSMAAAGLRNDRGFCRRLANHGRLARHSSAEHRRHPSYPDPLRAQRTTRHPRPQPHRSERRSRTVRATALRGIPAHSRGRSSGGHLRCSPPCV